MIGRFIPPRFHFFLFSLKTFFTGGYRRTCYSQAGEDLAAAYIFHRKKIKKGFYVDIGAHHPSRGSNTHYFYKRGWKGINIEPNPNMRWLFRVFRPRDAIISAGVGPVAGSLEYFMFSEPGINTFSRFEADAARAKGNVPYLGSRMIPVFTLNSILEQYAVKEIDLLSVDAEGIDLSILESLDWSRWKPLVIIVESHGFDVSSLQENPVYRFLTSKQYALSACTGVNLIFKRLA